MTQPPDIHRHYAPRPDVLAQRLDDEVVVINLDSDHIFALNITAGRLWELLVAGHSPAEARDVLLSEFTGITASEVTNEIEATLAVWLAEGLMDGT